MRPPRPPEADRRLVLVGQAPNRVASALVQNRPALALTGAAGRRLARLAGMSWWAYLRQTKRLNVFGAWQGRRGEGDAFPMQAARSAARHLAEFEFEEGQRVIYLGSAVARAFGEKVAAPGASEHGTLRPFRWTMRICPTPRGPVFSYRALLPHPSGRNRWWNVPANRRRAAAFLRRAFELAAS